MSGKVWIFISAISCITHIYHVQSKCMDQDIKLHLDELLLKEHMFRIKVFSPDTKEHELLSVVNTLCAYWTNNKDKDIEKLQVLKTFDIMLHELHKQFEDVCTNLNCTEAYAVHAIDTAAFGEMYRNSCNLSVSDLKCPSKSEPLTTISPTPEFNLTADPSAQTEAIIKDGSQRATHGLLIVSFLLNIFLLFVVLNMYRKSKTHSETPHESQVI
ncbi:uncharacterized protein LOC122341756 isoform X3 [Puntigrus tetrazona]|uniref:uncharacterized protein LOC122341756 isoform X3 n=1 Tax=Puntigrus tetrazona TaxID=1606681 RepID=UPI001C8A95CB|nr:uncharacterized protein LOC122341756 isoform X3 [Puntigrus tetrazona]